MKLWTGLAAALCVVCARAETKLVPHTMRLADGRTVTLNLPAEFEVNAAVEGMRRVPRSRPARRRCWRGIPIVA